MRLDFSPILVVVMLAVPLMLFTQLGFLVFGLGYLCIMLSFFLIMVKTEFLLVFKKRFLGQKTWAIVRFTRKDLREEEILTKNPSQYLRNEGTDVEETYFIKGIHKMRAGLEVPIHEFYEGYPDNVDGRFVKFIRDLARTDPKKYMEEFNENLNVAEKIPVSHDARLLNAKYKMQLATGIKHGMSKFMGLLSQNRLIMFLVIFNMILTAVLIVVTYASWTAQANSATAIAALEAMLKANTITPAAA